MRFSSFSLNSLILVSALAIAAPGVNAHNPAKYTNVPFVVTSSCQNVDPNLSSTFVSSGGTLKVKVVSNNDYGAGIAIYTSQPGAPNRSIFVPANPFPQGVLTFTVSGLPSGGSIPFFVDYADSSSSSGTITSNGVVSVPANQPSTSGAQPTFISLPVLSGTTGTYATVYMSNFVYNSAPLLFDTTLTSTICS